MVDSLRYLEMRYNLNFAYSLFHQLLNEQMRMQ
jgi:hypothetical protein